MSLGASQRSEGKFLLRDNRGLLLTGDLQALKACSKTEANQNEVWIRSETECDANTKSGVVFSSTCKGVRGWHSREKISGF